MEGYRVRVGDYRIIYTVDDTAHVVEIIAVDLRERVYRCGKRRS
jgi:mRNA-degrading endonuclease RelE of RelBE toxin-antitoxin system